MSLASRVADLASAVGADIKDLRTRADAAGLILGSGAVVTAAQNLAPGRTYFVDATNSIFSLTFPSAPPNGSKIKLIRLDKNSANYVQLVTALSTDKFFYTVGSTLASTYLGYNYIVEYEYLNGVWYASNGGFADQSYAAGGTPLLVDSTNRPGSNQAPVATTDLTNKAYVDGVGNLTKWYEEYQPATKTLAAGWQLITTGAATLKGRPTGGMLNGTSYGTTTYDGLYSFGFSAWMATGATAAGRLVGQWASGTIAGSGTPYARSESTLNAAGSASYGYYTVNCTGRKYLPAGSQLNASIYANGGSVASVIFGTLWFCLDETY